MIFDIQRLDVDMFEQARTSKTTGYLKPRFSIWTNIFIQSLPNAYSADSGHRFHAKADSHSKAKWTHLERRDAGGCVFTLKPPGLSILPVFCTGIRPPA